MELVEENPFNISLVVQKILSKFDDEKLWEVRILNSFWLNEVNHLMCVRNSKKKIVNFRSKNEISKFTDIFAGAPLHDSFNLNFYHETQHETEFYRDFIMAFGPHTKYLDLTNHPYSKRFEHEDSRMFFSFFKPMFANLLERILFEEFPNLVVLLINVSNSGREASHLVFPKVDELEMLYSRHQLPSLKALNLNVEWNWDEAGKEYLILAEEIMKLAPNLSEVNVRVNGRNSIGLTKLFQIVLSTISEFSPKVRVLTFDTNLDLSGNWICKEFDREMEFQNLNLKSITINENSLVSPVDFKSRFDFFAMKTPLSSTVQELQLISKKGLSILEEFPKNFLSVKFHYIPFGFRNLRKLELVHPFNQHISEDFFNDLHPQAPLIGDLNLSMIPSFPQFESLISWPLLNKLSMNNKHELHWNDLEGFLSFNKLLRKLAPNLRGLSISLGSKERQCYVRNTKSHLLAYPFFVWMGIAWENLKSVNISLDDGSLAWSKGSQERHMGMGAMKDLSDRYGSFTTRKISKLNFSLVLYRNEFLYNNNAKNFLSFLHSSFPKHKTLNQLLDGTDFEADVDENFLLEQIYTSMLKEKNY